MGSLDKAHRFRCGNSDPYRGRAAQALPPEGNSLPVLMVISWVCAVQGDGSGKGKKINYEFSFLYLKQRRRKVPQQEYYK